MKLHKWAWFWAANLIYFARGARALVADWAQGNQRIQRLALVCREILKAMRHPHEAAAKLRATVRRCYWRFLSLPAYCQALKFYLLEPANLRRLGRQALVLLATAGLAIGALGQGDERAPLRMTFLLAILLVIAAVAFCVRLVSRSRVPGPVLWAAQLFYLGVFFTLAAVPASGQTYLDEPGIPAFTTAFPVEYGFINLANGALHIEIPIGGSYAQRGNLKALRPRLVYDSRFWTFDPNPDDVPSGWQPNGVTGYPAPFAAGWRLISEGQAGNPTMSQQLLLQCTINGQQLFKTKYTNYRYQEPDGTIHRFPSITLTQLNPNCGGTSSGTASAYASDNSGIRMDVANFVPSAVYAPGGTQLYPTVQDTNGNFFTETLQQVTGVGFIDHVVDTLGREPVIASFSGNPVNQLFFDYLNPQGTRSRITVALGTINAATQFGTGGDFTGTLGVVQSITLADGSSYQFQEDSYGMITSMTLPTGGQVTYGYTNTTAPNQVNRWVSSRTADGQTWAFTPTFISCTTPCTPLTVTVTTPSYNDGSATVSDNHVYSFFFASPNGGGGDWNKQVQYFRGATSGTPVLTITKDYDGGLVPLLIRETLAWPTASGTLNKKAEYSYDSLGVNLITKKLWDYQPNGSFAAAPDREVDNIYVTDPAYVNANLLSLLQSTTIKNSAGTQAAQTTYGYDESAVQSSGITTQLHMPSGPRGNLTSAHRWLNGSTASTTNCPVSVSNGFLVSYTKYFDTGMIYQSTDACGSSAGDANHTTTSSYSSTFAGAYLTSVTNPLTQTVSMNYDVNTGLKTSFTDANSPANTTSYTYDNMLRPLCTNFPDNGQVCLSYPDANTAKRLTKINSLNSDTFTTKFDGLGRQSQTQHVTPSGTALVDTTYDALGRAVSVSNPYFLTSDPTYGVTTGKYDALSRIISTTRQDGSVTTAAYSANCTTITDEAGKARKMCHDGFGRTTSVFEDPAGLNYETDYGYDVLGNLLRVDQKGTAPTDSTLWRTRLFTYDSLSQLLTANNPESGAITYTYDADGNVITKTDARNVTTTYAYDRLNRLTSKTYSDGTTPSASFTYDEVASWLSNTIGQLTTATTSNGGVTHKVFSYDPMGRVNKIIERTTGEQWVGNATATYDLAGNLATLGYPDGQIVNYTPNISGSMVSAIDSNNINFVTAATYGPHNLISGFINGQSSGFAGIFSTFVYNIRLQPCRIAVSNSAAVPQDCLMGLGNVLDLGYDFHVGNGDNGNVLGINKYGDQTRNRAFTYDALNRLASAQNAGTDCTVTLPDGHTKFWGNNYGYDAWGNLLQKNVTKCSAENLQVAAASNNRLVGYSYDAAGNLLSDVSHQYTYDAENRISQVDNGAAIYTYGADGQRLRKDVGAGFTEYIDFGGNAVAERSPLALSSSMLSERGLSSYIPGAIVDGSIACCGWATDSSNAGAWLQVDLGAGNAQAVLQARIYTSASTIPYAGNYTVQYSDDGATWSAGATNFVPSQTGWNSITWQSVGIHRWWRLYLTNTPGSGAWLNELQLVGETNYIYFNGKRIARRDPSGAVSYYFADHLNSTSVITDSAGNIKSDSDYYPWGAELKFTANDSGNHYKFTGKERDSESGLDYLGARYYGNTLGRFLTPDWSLKPEAVPYADVRDPQSLNLYSYVRNRPTVVTDADGHDKACAKDYSCKSKATTQSRLFVDGQNVYVVTTTTTVTTITDNNTGASAQVTSTTTQAAGWNWQTSQYIGGATTQKTSVAYGIGGGLYVPVPFSSSSSTQPLSESEANKIFKSTILVPAVRDAIGEPGFELALKEDMKNHPGKYIMAGTAVMSGGASLGGAAVTAAVLRVISAGAALYEAITHAK